MSDQNLNRHRVTSTKQQGFLALKGISAGAATLIAIVLAVAAFTAYKLVVNQIGNAACNVAHCSSVPKLDYNFINHENQNTARQLTTPQGNSGFFGSQTP